MRCNFYCNSSVTQVGILQKKKNSQYERENEKKWKGQIESTSIFVGGFKQAEIGDSRMSRVRRQ